MVMTEPKPTVCPTCRVNGGHTAFCPRQGKK